MISFHYSEQLRWGREKAGWSLSRLSLETGIDRRRLSEFECNRRRPDEEQAEILNRVLGIRLNLLGRRSWRLSNPLRVELYRPKVEHKFRRRLNACRRTYSVLTALLEADVMARADFSDCLDALVNLRLDSGLETLVILQLLASGAEIGYACPGSLGYYGPRVVTPENRKNGGHLAWLVLRIDKFYFFPQVSLDVYPGIRVDFLCCDMKGGEPHWSVLEVDGPGHVPDSSREGLPFRVLRISEGDCKRRDLVDWLLSELRKRAPQLRRWSA